MIVVSRRDTLADSKYPRNRILFI